MRYNEHQVVIEDSLHRYTLWSERHCHTECYHFACLFDCYGFGTPDDSAKVVIPKNGKATYEMEIGDDFLCMPDCRRFRLHFLFKPSFKKRLRGRKRVIFSSNWFDVP